MNKTVLSILIVGLTSVTGGCSYFSDFNEARKEVEESAKKPIPIRVNADNKPAETKETEEVAENETEAETEPTQAIAGLVSATDPETRVRKSVRGRVDPFSVVTLVPKIEVEEVEEKPQPNNNRNNLTNRQRNRIVQNPNNSNSRNNNRLPNPPKLFEPELAREVVISGMYESNGTTKLIVNAPEENSSRYVEVGQYLSNGQVLVKSVDRNHFPAPLVTLEQAGVEVYKTIGETPEESRRISSLPTQTPNQTLLSNISLNLTNPE